MCTRRCFEAAGSGPSGEQLLGQCYLLGASSGLINLGDEAGEGAATTHAHGFAQITHRAGGNHIGQSLGFSAEGDVVSEFAINILLLKIHICQVTFTAIGPGEAAFALDDVAVTKVDGVILVCCASVE